MLILFAKLRTGGKWPTMKKRSDKLRPELYQRMIPHSFLNKASGSRTPEGKDRSKYNAVKHGIFF